MPRPSPASLRGGPALISARSDGGGKHMMSTMGRSGRVIAGQYRGPGWASTGGTQHQQSVKDNSIPNLHVPTLGKSLLMMPNANAAPLGESNRVDRTKVGMHSRKSPAYFEQHYDLRNVPGNETEEDRYEGILDTQEEDPPDEQNLERQYLQQVRLARTMDPRTMMTHGCASGTFPAPGSPEKEKRHWNDNLKNQTTDPLAKHPLRHMERQHFPRHNGNLFVLNKAVERGDVDESMQRRSPNPVRDGIYGYLHPSYYLHEDTKESIMKKDFVPEVNANAKKANLQRPAGRLTAGHVIPWEVPETVWMSHLGTDSLEALKNGYYTTDDILQNSTTEQQRERAVRQMQDDVQKYYEEQSRIPQNRNAGDYHNEGNYKSERAKRAKKQLTLEQKYAYAPWAQQYPENASDIISDDIELSLRNNANMIRSMSSTLPTSGNLPYGNIPAGKEAPDRKRDGRHNFDRNVDRSIRGMNPHTDHDTYGKYGANGTNKALIDETTGEHLRVESIESQKYSQKPRHHGRYSPAPHHALWTPLSERHTQHYSNPSKAELHENVKPIDSHQKIYVQGPGHSGEKQMSLPKYSMSATMSEPGHHDQGPRLGKRQASRDEIRQETKPRILVEKTQSKDDRKHSDPDLRIDIRFDSKNQNNGKAAVKDVNVSTKDKQKHSQKSKHEGTSKYDVMSKVPSKHKSHVLDAKHNGLNESYDYYRQNSSKYGVDGINFSPPLQYVGIDSKNPPRYRGEMITPTPWPGKKRPFEQNVYRNAMSSDLIARPGEYYVYDGGSHQYKGANRAYTDIKYGDFNQSGVALKPSAEKRKKHNKQTDASNPNPKNHKTSMHLEPYAKEGQSKYYDHRSSSFAYAAEHLDAPKRDHWSEFLGSPSRQQKQMQLRKPRHQVLMSGTLSGGMGLRGKGENRDQIKQSLKNVMVEK